MYKSHGTKRETTQAMSEYLDTVNTLHKAICFFISW